MQSNEPCFHFLTAPGTCISPGYWTLHYLSHNTDASRIATGDLDEDAQALRHFMPEGTFEISFICSFSKDNDFCGEEVRAFHLKTA